MRRSFFRVTLASGTLLLGSIAFGQNQPANQPVPRVADQRMATVVTQALAFPQGFVNKELNEGADIKSELATLTTDALSKDHFDNFIGNLAKQDKTRIGDSKNRDATVLNGRIDQIQKAWKQKYGKDFDVDRKVVFDDRYAILEGEISDPALALSTWPVPATGTQAIQASQRQAPALTATNMKEAENDAKLDKGRNVALVRFPASHGMAAITASMIHELPDQWRVDVPNDRTGQQIYDSLLKHLTYLGDHVDQWPADVNDAYRHVAHCALASIYGVEMEMPDSSLPRP
jgi:hypothetical protein